ncbi:hypothetical protein HXX76_003974 [Chlamydomonas incerta]|uniref:Protein kinase domain-containing protein n=1 Tax=Chlamydomonas incerta TaxID=51695 RepID=A0A835TCH7_CHLIN|nr:hypothetical protein HXX76_003974 [Chlamydomonas incerta]|eukprot:KAG2441122.1 hypothetical protein HXX76_003974 [Chlamydomonas incerta]
MLFTVGSGNVVTWMGLDIFTSSATLGPTFRPLGQSPGAIMMYDGCLIHRLVGLPIDARIANAMSLPRPPGYPGPQQLVAVTNFTFITTDRTPPRVLARTSQVIDYAAYAPPDSSLAGQGLFFGGWTVWTRGPSYNVDDYTIDAACLAVKSGNECLALAIADIEAEKLRQAQQQQQEAAAKASSSGDSDTTTIVVAVVVPVGVVLLAALVGSIWWVRRSRRRELEQLQRAKAAAKAADIEAGGGGGAASSDKAGRRGGRGGGARRLGVLAGGVQDGDGGIFLGVDGDKDLPEWSEAAHNAGDGLGDLSQAGPATGLAGTDVWGAGSSTALGSLVKATVTSSMASQAPPPVDSVVLLELEAGPQQPQGQPQPQAAVVGTGGVEQRGPQGQPPDAKNGKQADDAPAAGGAEGGRGTYDDRSQRFSRVSAARKKPALTCALEGTAAPAALTLGSAGTGDGGQAAHEQQQQQQQQPLTEYALSTGTGGGLVDIKVPAHAPSPAEVVAELNTLVRELRDSVNHVAIMLEGVLGHGSFGTVYKGTWQGLTVAVKTVVFTANQENRKHALKEAALCQSINHPNIIATYASELQPIGMLPASAAKADDAAAVLPAGSNTPPVSGARLHLNIKDWRLYIIQEYAEGGPLGNLYGHPALWYSPGIVDLPAVLPLALGIARALEHLHSKRIVHGDLNPNNVLLKRDPAEPCGYAVKVGDFGLSVMLPTDRTHLSNLRMGTMFYICPAVAWKGQIGPAADVFSLGVILWELFHGRRAGMWTQEGPLYCSNFPAFPPSCPKIYKAVTLQCLQRQPQKRPPVAAVVSSLELLLAATPARRSPADEVMTT